MANISITLVRSLSGKSGTQRATIEALGLGRIRQTVVLADSAGLRGQLDKVAHLVRWEEADG